MSDTIKGVVEKKARTGKGIMIDGDWWNTGFPANLEHVEVGDEVEFKTKGKFINGKPKKHSGGGSSAGGASGGGQTKSDLKVSRDRSIARQNALQHAARIVAAEIAIGKEPEDVTSQVIGYAQDFEMYTTGELDEMSKKEFIETEEGF